MPHFISQHKRRRFVLYQWFARTLAFLQNECDHSQLTSVLGDESLFFRRLDQIRRRADTRLCQVGAEWEETGPGMIASFAIAVAGCLAD